jgi:hypothetical protein
MLVVKVDVVIRAAALFATFAVIAAGLIGSVAADNESKTAAIADANGNLHVPDGYRTAYEFLGTWAVAADQARGSQELHTVYASPGTIAAFRKDGSFPDGTVLVKEVFRAATGEMTTGTISHADSLRGWFVMTKDSTGRFAATNQLVWGDGWGWSWFDAGNPSTASRSLPLPGGAVEPTSDYRDNCKGCHQPAQATDWIYIQGYPALKR